LLARGMIDKGPNNSIELRVQSQSGGEEESGGQKIPCVFHRVTLQ
jgi:hypothetical protein